MQKIYPNALMVKRSQKKEVVKGFLFLSLILVCAGTLIVMTLLATPGSHASERPENFITCVKTAQGLSCRP